MKKYILLILVMIVAQTGWSQTDSVSPPYKRFPTVPPLRLLLADSSTFFSKADLKKKTPVMIMLFNPQCEHCQHETEEIIKNIDKFKKIQIIMATTFPIDSLRSFSNKYKLDQFENIVVGQDQGYFLMTYYKMSNFPLLAFYNKKQELISVFEGSLGIPKILEEFDK